MFILIHPPTYPPPPPPPPSPRPLLGYHYSTGSDLSGQNLNGFDLSDAILTRANLTGADISDTIVTGTVFSHCDLHGRDFSNMDLTGADLQGANLQGMDLSGATVTDVNWVGADLSGAILDGIVGLTMPRRSKNGDKSIEIPVQIAELAIRTGLLVRAVEKDDGSLNMGDDCVFLRGTNSGQPGTYVCSKVSSIPQHGTNWDHFGVPEQPKDIVMKVHAVGQDKSSEYGCGFFYSSE